MWGAVDRVGGIAGGGESGGESGGGGGGAGPRPPAGRVGRGGGAAEPLPCTVCVARSAWRVRTPGMSLIRALTTRTSRRERIPATRTTITAPPCAGRSVPTVPLGAVRALSDR